MFQGLSPVFSPCHMIYILPLPCCACKLFWALVLLLSSCCSIQVLVDIWKVQVINNNIMHIIYNASLTLADLGLSRCTGMLPGAPGDRSRSVSEEEGCPLHPQRGLWLFGYVFLSKGCVLLREYPGFWVTGGKLLLIRWLHGPR